jgi:hypothetical protein
LAVVKAEDMPGWIKALEPLTIQSTFHTKFQPVKTIGKGSFAKVPKDGYSNYSGFLSWFRSILSKTEKQEPDPPARHSQKTAWSSKKTAEYFS